MIPQWGIFYKFTF